MFLIFTPEEKRYRSKARPQPFFAAAFQEGATANKARKRHLPIDAPDWMIRFSTYAAKGRKKEKRSKILTETAIKL